MTPEEYLAEAEGIISDIDKDDELDSSDVDALYLAAIAHAVTGLLKVSIPRVFNVTTFEYSTEAHK